MVTLEELSIILPIITTIAIPIILIGITRYFRTSDNLTTTSTVSMEAIKDLEAYVKNHKQESKDIWEKLGELDKILYNIKWRVEDIEDREREHKNKG